MWQIVAAVALGGMQAGAQRKAGAAAYRESLRQAAEIRKQRFGIQELTAQQHAQRLEQFSDLQSTNNAFAAFMGRSDRSIAALRGEERRRYGQDVARMQEQERRELEQIETQARTEVSRGVSAKKAANAAATASMLGTLGSAALMTYNAPTGGSTTTQNTIGGGTGYKSVLDNPLAPKTQLAF